MIMYATPTVGFVDSMADARITHTDVVEAAAAVRNRETVILPDQTTAANVLIAVGCPHEHAWMRVHFAKTGELNPYSGAVLAMAS